MLTRVASVGYCERLWVGWEEGEGRIERSGEEGDSRRVVSKGGEERWG